MNHMRTLGMILGGAGMVFLANLYGFWQVTCLLGIVWGIFTSTRRAIGSSLLSAALGWGAGIIWIAMKSDHHLLPLASLLGQILGLGSIGSYLVLLLPSLLGGVLALCSAWIISTCRLALVRKSSSQATEAPPLS